VDFSVEHDDQLLQQRIVKFARGELAGLLAQAGGGFPDGAWRACGRFGLLGLPLPVEYGGGGAAYSSCALGMEAFGYASPSTGLNLAAGVHVWACAVPLWRFGGQALRSRYLPRLASGESIGALAVTEPQAGSDVDAIETTAAPAGDGFMLNGGKVYITNAPVADVFLVLARHEPDAGRRPGHTMFLVDRSSAGLSIEESVAKPGLAGASIGALSLRDCRVPGDRVLGGVGQGKFVFNLCMELERTYLFAIALGTLRRILERSVDRARTRLQAGRPIGDHQSVSNRLVDTKVTLDLARLLVMKIGWLHDQGRSAYYEAAVLKLVVAEGLDQAARDDLRIHGAAGYFSADVYTDVLDSIASPIYSGTSEVQRLVIARYLGL
jgi:alkylation response protein AidB-like acyl-CoA dehydrogenase